MTRRTTATLTALVLALAVTGCSDDGNDDPTVAEPTAGASVAGTSAAPEFASTQELADALNTGGLTCTELRDGQFPGVSQAQSCILNESEDVVLLKFADESEKADYLANRDELASAVVGGDWAVQTVLPESAQAVAGVIGGEVVTGPPAG